MTLRSLVPAAAFALASTLLGRQPQMTSALAHDAIPDPAKLFRKVGVAEIPHEREPLARQPCRRLQPTRRPVSRRNGA